MATSSPPHSKTQLPKPPVSGFDNHRTMTAPTRALARDDHDARHEDDLLLPRRRPSDRMLTGHASSTHRRPQRTASSSSSAGVARALRRLQAKQRIKSVRSPRSTGKRRQRTLDRSTSSHQPRRRASLTGSFHAASNGLSNINSNNNSVTNTPTAHKAHSFSNNDSNNTSAAINRQLFAEQHEEKKHMHLLTQGNNAQELPCSPTKRRRLQHAPAVRTAPPLEKLNANKSVAEVDVSTDMSISTAGASIISTSNTISGTKATAHLAAVGTIAASSFSFTCANAATTHETLSQQHYTQLESAAAAALKCKITGSNTVAAANTRSGDRFIPNRDESNLHIPGTPTTAVENIDITKRRNRANSLLSPMAVPSPFSQRTVCSQRNSGNINASIASEELHSDDAEASVSAAAATVKEGYGRTLSVRSQLDFKAQLSLSLFSHSDDMTKRRNSKAAASGSGAIPHHKALLELQGTDRERYALNSREAPRQRYISGTPGRILDAPDLLNDFYLNLMHWSHQNHLFVGLASYVYLWDAAVNSVSKLCDVESGMGDAVTSVKASPSGAQIAVGTHTSVKIYDVETQQLVRTVHHSVPSSSSGVLGRVGVLAWHPRDQQWLSTGGADARIVNHDLRLGGLAGWRRGSGRSAMGGATVTSQFCAHKEELCGMEWNANGTFLASGGNDNLMCVWDVSKAQDPHFIAREHTAAVKALAWCPWQRNLLATGAGTADRHIRFYNTDNGAVINSINSGSQVSGLVWSPHSREIASSHGYSRNHIAIWKYPSMKNIVNLTGHTGRILTMVPSPDQETVCSAGADETLRFWKIWDKQAAQLSRRSSAAMASQLAGDTSGRASMSAALQDGNIQSRGNHGGSKKPLQLDGTQDKVTMHIR